MKELTVICNCGRCGREDILTAETAELRWRTDSAGDPEVLIFSTCSHCGKINKIPETKEVYSLLKERIDKHDFAGSGYPANYEG